MSGITEKEKMMGLLMLPDEIKRFCAARGAILTEDHVVLTPKPDGFYHAPGYFDKDKVLSSAQALNSIAYEFAARFANTHIETVAGPTVGAVGLASAVAIQLFERGQRDVDWVYAEEAPVEAGQAKGSKKRVIKRCFPAYVKGRRVLVVEDVFSSGGSAKETVVAVQEAGGVVVGVAVICNRSALTAQDLGVPDLKVLFDIPIVMHREEKCPLCAQNIPINMRVGHGTDFYKRHPESQVPKRQ